MINVVAKNRSWLFEDLKVHFEEGGRRLGVEVKASEEPLAAATSWIYLRTHEAASSPDPQRTLVQIHDMFADDYGEGGPRRIVERCGGVCLTHPDQRNILSDAGISLKGKKVLCRPIGASKAFRPENRLPPDGRPFTVGWVGRPMNYRGQDIKRCDEAAAILAAAAQRVLLVGQNLDAMAESAWAAIDASEGSVCEQVLVYDRPPLVHADYPALYGEMDALLIWSTMEAGPLCLFEALASGVPVVSSLVGWAAGLATLVADSPERCKQALALVRKHSGWYYDHRVDLAANSWRLDWQSQRPASLEGWIEDNVWLAV